MTPVLHDAIEKCSLLLTFQNNLATNPLLNAVDNRSPMRNHTDIHVRPCAVRSRQNTFVDKSVQCFIKH
jgi:hypothetical protein